MASIALVVVLTTIGCQKKDGELGAIRGRSAIAVQFDVFDFAINGAAVTGAVRIGTTDSVDASVNIRDSNKLVAEDPSMGQDFLLAVQVMELGDNLLMRQTLLIPMSGYELKTAKKRNGARPLKCSIGALPDGEYRLTIVVMEKQTNSLGEIAAFNYTFHDVISYPLTVSKDAP
jgi:hypothetical protein